MRFIACVFIAVFATGCAGRAIPRAATPNAEAPPAPAATTAGSGLSEFIEKVRKLSAEARPEPNRAASVEGTFRTAPGERDPRTITLVYSGDADGTPEPRDGAPRFGPFPVLWRAAAERPDLFVFLGDTVYVDAPGLPPARSLDAIRARHRLKATAPGAHVLSTRRS